MEKLGASDNSVWTPWGHIWDIMGLTNGPNWSAWMSLLYVYLEKRPNMVWPDAPCCVPTLFHPFQPKIGLLGRFVWLKGYFQLIWDTFWPPLDHTCDILGLANRPNWSAWMSSKPFQPFSNIVPLNRWANITLIVKLPIFGPFRVFFGPWEGPNMINALCSSWNRGLCT